LSPVDTVLQTKTQAKVKQHSLGQKVALILR